MVVPLLGHLFAHLPQVLFHDLFVGVLISADHLLSKPHRVGWIYGLFKLRVSKFSYSFELELPGLGVRIRHVESGTSGHRFIGACSGSSHTWSQNGEILFCAGVDSCVAELTEPWHLRHIILGDWLWVVWFGLPFEFSSLWKQLSNFEHEFDVIPAFELVLELADNLFHD